MKHLLLTLMALTVCLTASAQKTDKVYQEAVALLKDEQRYNGILKRE